MVREDNTEDRLKSQKSAGLGPATLDLNATEVAAESQTASTEATSEPVEPVISSLDTSAASAKSGESPASSEAAPDIAAPKLDVFDPPPQQRSSLPLVLAALVGGVAGGALVLAAGAFNLVPLGKSGGDDSLSPRIVAAEQDIASNKAAIDQALTKVGAIEVAAKTAQDAANNALNLAGEAQKAAGATPEAPSAPATIPDLSSLTDRLTKAEADISTLNDAMRQVGTATNSLSQQIAQLKAAASATPDKAAAYAVALSQLSETIRSGKPFAAELSTATALDAGAQALAPLSSYAQTGLPSIEALATSFDALKPQIAAALTPKTAPPPPDAGVVDRLLSSLGNVVTVTRDGEGTDGDPTVPVQKISDALHKGDLPGALAAFKALPEAGQQAGAAWLAQATDAATALDLIKAQTSAALQKFSGQ